MVFGRGAECERVIDIFGDLIEVDCQCEKAAHKYVEASKFQGAVYDKAQKTYIATVLLNIKYIPKAHHESPHRP